MLPLFTLPADPSLLSYGRYDPQLVALSLVVAIFSSWMGLQIAGQPGAGRAQRAIVLGSASLALGAALGAIRAGSPADPASTAAASAGDIGRARRAGNVLLQALGRGALDDAALAGLVAALAGHPAAHRVSQVQAALADFDFELALAQLEAVLAAIDDTAAQEAVQ